MKTAGAPQKWRDMSILRKLTLGYLCLIVLPLLLLLLINFITLNEQNRREADYNCEYVLYTVQAGIENKMRSVEMTVGTIVNSGAVSSFFSKTFHGAPSFDEYDNRVIPLLESMLHSVSPVVERVFVVTQNNAIPEGYNIVYHEKNYTSPELEQFVESGADAAWFFTPDGLERNSKASYSDQEFIYIHKMVSPYGKVTGYVVSTVKAKELLGDLLADSGHNAMLLLSDGEGNLIMSNMLLGADAVLTDYTVGLGSGFLSKTAPVSGLPVELTVVVESAKQGIIAQNTFLMVAIMSVMFLLFLLLFYGYIRDIIYRMQSYTMDIEQIVENNFQGELVIEKNDEIGWIGGQFNRMLKKIKVLLFTIIQKETAHKETQLKALLLQINPHFIYNTLDLFAGRMQLENQFEMADHLYSFSQMIRYNISSTSMFTSLAAELEHTDNYISLQKCRYGDAVACRVFCPEERRGIRVLRFLIQPIVENCFEHGFSGRKRGDPKHVSIAVKVLEEKYWIRIKDNGVGISPKKLEEMNRRFAADTQIDSLHYEDKKHGIGLENINDRLRLFYGQEHHLLLKSGEGKYTAVFIVFDVGGSR